MLPSGPSRLIFRFLLLSVSVPTDVATLWLLSGIDYYSRNSPRYNSVGILACTNGRLSALSGRLEYQDTFWKKMHQYIGLTQQIMNRNRSLLMP